MHDGTLEMKVNTAKNEQAAQTGHSTSNIVDVKDEEKPPTRPGQKAKVKGAPRAPRTSAALPASDPQWKATVDGLLQNTAALDIQPKPDMNFQIQRRFLNHHYDCNTGSFLAIMKPAYNPSSTPNNPRPRPILFPFYEENPDLPAHPGATGIILTAREDILEIQPVSIFINYAGRGHSPSVWLYSGDYELENCAVMTGEQFSRQPRKTKERWGNSILDLKRDVWSLMRARIYLRKQGIPLTEQSVHAEHQKIKAKRSGPVELQDVIDAFVNEEEHLNIIRMKCVTYDHDFIEDLKTRHEVWLKSPKKASHVGEGKRTRSQAKPSKVEAKSTSGLVKQQHVDGSILTSTKSGPQESASSSVLGLRRSARRSARIRKTLGRTLLPDTDNSDHSVSEFEASEDENKEVR
ncbi:hypothetical protein BDP27DRAFT_126325 [Rhodocollybia butyracea]|uniref:DUF6697 domain-containing protein n=1 Tax=Rhodocollybia butyracea TaxID=206335 RepID=A0A9P5PK22_9AGAR|nr:hypothetical protein BDP27DRAFT_126325 [Rhodocollybia butyracea]